MALLRALTLTLLALFILAGSYYLVVRENFATVIPGQVYRSAQLDGERLKEIIQQYSIRSVINLRGAEPGKSWYEEERAVTTKLGTNHQDIRFAAEGLPPVRQVLRLLETLNSAERPVLFHCLGGADRTGMASAMTLLLEGTLSLQEIKEQVSLQYLVFWSDSVGKLLLEQYYQWLGETNTPHSPEIFTNWLESIYMDANGNLLFYIDQINQVMWKSGTRYEDGYSYMVNKVKNPQLEVSGWAIDVRNKQLVQQVSIYLGEQLLGASDYGFAYSGVANYLGDARYVDSGWMLRKPVQNWKDGCYDLTLEITRLNSTIWRSPPQAKVCIN